MQLVFMENNVEKMPANRLIDQKSPYLLQHAYNPVDWYPWGDEAFDRAKSEDKPVFLSIGYSSCHWCHVMEEESFSDKEVAILMNEAFVCIKVDREERPDIDSVYMKVCRVMGQNCGWPLNIIMTPDKIPFFVSSYIPKKNKFGLVGMIELIPQIREVWSRRRTQLEAAGKEVSKRLETLSDRKPERKLGENVLDDAYERLYLSFDEENGGFGRAPKFPMPHKLLFLLRYWKRSKDKTSLTMVEKTLEAMRKMGIFDQIGFGFHRYSTDSSWLIPHFEKMLYDQALLATVYTEAYQATKKEEFKEVVTEIFEYVLRDLSSPEGTFFSSEDADSEGKEGKYYLWTEKEINNTLPPKEAELAKKIFGVQFGGNYVDGHIQSRNGKNILHLAKPFSQVALEFGLAEPELHEKMEKIREVLYVAREKRFRPEKDYKVLTSWNGLMIAALARASQVFGVEPWLSAAKRAADFFLGHMRGEKGLLFHRFAKGEKAIVAFLDDYAFLVWGLIEIYEACFQKEYLLAGSRLTEIMISEFWDENDSGFYFTSKEAEKILVKLKKVQDGATPSGNSVAMLNLLRLSRLTGNTSFQEIADKTSQVFSEEVRCTPEAHTFLLLGVDFALGPTYTVVLVGSHNEEGLLDMLDVLRQSYQPNLVVIHQSPEEEAYSPDNLDYRKIGGRTTAYVCKDRICLPPTNNTKKMLELLELQ